METKKKQYKPGQLITLKGLGVYQIRKTRNSKDFRLVPECAWCEFRDLDGDCYPCSPLCMHTIPFTKYVEYKDEKDRIIPNGCFLVEIKRIEEES